MPDFSEERKRFEAQKYSDRIVSPRESDARTFSDANGDTDDLKAGIKHKKSKSNDRMKVIPDINDPDEKNSRYT